ncbi:Cysteine-rich_protein [Hexamita inflata]|uniref:Cysteine-rich protein n=1 Tax=Hexamita inflata TaxID=28002 RepID=A0AA86REH2_9EUKA|nr:Cysteine-rich protein [Hexamita inflata]CAI9973238.1 Cysteine-rich protein [Hexamita inflata]
MRIQYIQQNCTQCSLCVQHCPTGAIQFDYKNRKLIFDQVYLCVECVSCVYACPFKAMVLQDAYKFDVSKVNE